MTDGVLNVSVIYPAAQKPFKDNETSADETLASLKTRVLGAFGLVEGTSPDGTVTTFTFHRGKDLLEDLSLFLGDIAGTAHALSLKLSQQITQG